MSQRAILDKILREAVARGELAPASDIAGLSWHFLGVLQAMMNLPQAGATSGELRRVVELAMLAWPSAPAAAAPQRSGKRRSSSARPSEVSMPRRASRNGDRS
jgi:hypothetical protein